MDRKEEEQEDTAGRPNFIACPSATRTSSLPSLLFRVAAAKFQQQSRRNLLLRAKSAQASSIFQLRGR